MSSDRESPIKMTTRPQAPTTPTHEAHAKSGNRPVAEEETAADKFEPVFQYYVGETCGLTNQRVRTGDLVFSVTESKDQIAFEYPDRGYHCFLLQTDVPFQDLDLKVVYDNWRKLLSLFKRVLQSASRNILRKDGVIPRALLRSLMEIADVVTHTEGVYSDLYDVLQGCAEEASHSIQEQDLNQTKRAAKDLSATIDTLILRASNIMSIDEAYKAREQGASIKRLTWITFIFLPLLTVSSLFGMNIDLLEDNPAWWTYLCFAAPMSVLIFLAFLGLKHKSILRNYVTKLGKRLGYPRSRRGLHGDEENQTYTDKGPSMLRYFEAAACGHTIMVINSISSGIPITAVDLRSRSTALHFAAENGHEATVRALVTDLGADVMAKDSEGRSALHDAAENGHEATVRLLVTGLGADVKAKEVNGRTPLHFAAHHNQEAVVRALVTELGADVEAKDDEGRTALHVSARYCQIMRTLVTELGADVEAKDNEGRTALHEAARNGREATVRTLVTELGADVEAKDNEGRTALHLARYEATIRLLVTDLGADVEAKDNKGITPLDSAAFWNGSPTIRTLLALNANEEATTKDGDTPLDLARKGGRGETVYALGGRID